MSFAYPAALAGLLIIPAIIALYLFRNKYSEKTVPSLKLIEQALKMSESARPWQKLRKSLLMILQLICAAVIVIFMARPYIRGEELSSDSIIVIDTGMSMQATDVTPTRLSSAKARARELISGMKPGDRASLVIMSKKPYIAASNSSDKQMLLEAIDRASPDFSAADAEAAEALVSSLSKGTDGKAEVILLSDGTSTLPSVASNIVFSESHENCAITLLSAVSAGDRFICLVKVKNFGDFEAERVLSLFADQKIEGSEDFILESGEERDFYFTITGGQAEISAKLEPGDILAADDSAYTVVSQDENRRVIYYTERNAFLHNALSVLPGISLFRGEPGGLVNSSGYSLYIYDGFLPEDLPTDGHIIIIAPPEGNELFQTGEALAVGALRSYGHPVLKYLENPDFSILSSPKIIPPENAEIIMSSDGNPLIFTYKSENRNIFVIGFDLHNSDLPLKREFPVLIYNIVRYMLPSLDSDGGTIYSGDAIDLPIDPESSSVLVIGPESEEYPLAPPFPVRPFSETGETGIYTLIQESASGQKISLFSVNAGGGNESDLHPIQAAAESVKSETRATSGISEFTPYFAVLLTALLCFEWRVYRRAV